MARLAVSLLGTFYVALSGQPVVKSFETDKTRGLLAYLMVEADRPHTRERLAGLLWPDYPDESARSSLRQALHNLRRALGEPDADSPYLLVTSGSVQFNAAADHWLDVTAFAERVAACRQHAHTRLETCSVCMARLEEALVLYRGDFLAGLRVGNSAAFEEWTLYWREYLHRLALESMIHLADYYERLGDYEQTWRWAERQLQMEPWREEAHRQLMRVLARLGQRSAALAQYETCRRALNQELGVEPSRETQRLYEAIRSEIDGPMPSSPATPPSAGRVAAPAPAPSPRRDPWSAFVGRDSELAQLDGYLAEALAAAGRVALVSGTAGSGKSALLREFARRTLAAQPDLVVVSGSCNAQTGIGDPYLPFRDILQTLSGDIEPRRAGHSITPDLAGRLWALLPDCVQALVEHGPDLVDLFVPGAPLLRRAGAATLWPPDSSASQATIERLTALVAKRPTEGNRAAANQADLFEQVTRVLRTLAASRPLLLLIDDLQWADSGSVALLFHLGRRLSGSRILLLGAYRSDEVALGHAGQRHPLATIRHEFEREYGTLMVDLTADPGRPFVDALLNSEPNRLAPAFRAALCAQTNGQALFTVETLRNLHERGELYQDEAGRWVAHEALDWGALPARVEAAIAERIDRLPERCRRILSAASVQGDDFTAEVVAEVIAAPLPEILTCLSSTLARQHRLVRPEALRRLSGARSSAYRFSHHLIQRYLYEQLDPVERAQLHSEVAASLDRQGATDPAERERLAALLAWHYEEAGLVLPAARALLDAGHQAMRVAAFREALYHFDRGLALLASEWPSAEQVQVIRLLEVARLAPQRQLEGTGSDGVYGTLVRASAAWAGQAQGRTKLTLLWIEAEHLLMTGQFATALDVLVRLRAEAVQADEGSFVDVADLCFGLTYHYIGNVRTSEAYLAALLERSAPERRAQLCAETGMDATALGMALSGLNRWLLGCPEAALARSQEATAAARAANAPVGLAASTAFGAELLILLRSDAAAVAELCECCNDLCRKHGLFMWSVFAEAVLDQVMVLRGEDIAGIERLWGMGWQHGSVAVGSDFFAVMVADGCLHAARRRAGDTRPAVMQERARLLALGLEAIDRMLGPVRIPCGQCYEPELRRLMGELLLARDGLAASDKALACFERALRLAQEQDMHAWELRVAASLARLWQRQGKCTEAHELLAGVYGRFTEGFDTPDLRDARALLQKLTPPATTRTPVLNTDPDN